MSSKKKRAVGKVRPAKAKARKAAPKKKRVAAKTTKTTAKARAPKAVVAKAPAKKVGKAVAKPRAHAKPKAKRVAQPAVKRRDGAGHLNPRYAEDLRARSRKQGSDDDRAFLGGKGSDDALSEELGAEFVETITSGEDEGNEVRDQRVVEEVGGPFTVTSGNTEFARGTDGSNPKSSTREPFPRT